MKRIQSRSQDKWMHGGNTLAYQHVSGGGRKSEPVWNLHRTTGGNLRTDLKSVFDSGVYERTTPQSIRVHKVWHTSCLNSSVFIFRFVDSIIFPEMLYTTGLLVVFSGVLVALTHGCNVTLTEGWITVTELKLQWRNISEHLWAHATMFSWKAPTGQLQTMKH